MATDFISEDLSVDELEAAGEMFDALQQGTFYEREAAAVRSLSENRKPALKPGWPGNYYSNNLSD